jgi:mono/diheme cytochrome c family protein
MKKVALLLPFVSAFLAQAQDLPAGKGKELVEKICQDCHGVDVIAAQRGTKDEWASIVDSMVAKGAGGTKDELATIVDYLAKNFGPDKKDGQSGNGQVSTNPRVR